MRGSHAPLVSGRYGERPARDSRFSAALRRADRRRKVRPRDIESCGYARKSDRATHFFR